MKNLRGLRTRPRKLIRPYSLSGRSKHWTGYPNGGGGGGGGPYPPGKTPAPSPSPGPSPTPSPGPSPSPSPVPPHLLATGNVCLGLGPSFSLDTSAFSGTTSMLPQTKACLEVKGAMSEITATPWAMFTLVAPNAAQVCASIEGRAYTNFVNDPFPITECTVCAIISGASREIIRPTLVALTGVSVTPAANACIVQNHYLYDTALFSMLTALPPKQETVSTCLSVNGESMSYVYVSLMSALSSSGGFPELAYICNNLDGNIATATLFPLTGVVAENGKSVLLADTLACIELDGNSSDQVAVSLSSTPEVLQETVTKTCLLMDGNEFTPTLNAITIDTISGPTGCLKIEGSNKSLSAVSLKEPLDAVTCSSTCLTLTGTMYPPGYVPLPPTGSYLFYAPTGQTGVGNNIDSDYVILTDSTLIFKQWDSVAGLYTNVTLEQFFDRRIAAPDDRIEFLDNDICAFSTELHLTFPQAVGQTATSIGLFYAQKLGTTSLKGVVDPITGELADVLPTGGATTTTDTATLPATTLFYKGSYYRLFRVLVQPPGTTMSVNPVCF